MRFAIRRPSSSSIRCPSTMNSTIVPIEIRDAADAGEDETRW